MTRVGVAVAAPPQVVGSGLEATGRGRAANPAGLTPTREPVVAATAKSSRGVSPRRAASLVRRRRTFVVPLLPTLVTTGRGEGAAGEVAPVGQVRAAGVVGAAGRVGVRPPTPFDRPPLEDTRAGPRVPGAAPLRRRTGRSRVRAAQEGEAGAHGPVHAGVGARGPVLRVRERVVRGAGLLGTGALAHAATAKASVAAGARPPVASHGRVPPREARR